MNGTWNGHFYIGTLIKITQIIQKIMYRRNIKFLKFYFFTFEVCQNLS